MHPPHLRTSFALLVCFGLASTAAAQQVWTPEVPVEPVFSTVDVRDLPVVLTNVKTPVPLPPPAPDIALTPPFVNIEGIRFTASTPPDPSGAVGPNHYVQVVNQWRGSVFSIYDKSGNQLSGPTHMKALVETGPCGVGGVSPLVLYDRDADRFLLTEISVINLFGLLVNHFCVYVSQTGDPVSGGWIRYELLAPFVPDFPKYGIWPDAYYVSTNEGFPALYAFPRHAMLAGEPVRHQRVFAPPLAGFPFQALTPADRDGANPPPQGSPGIFIRHRDDEVHDPQPDPTRDFLEVFRLVPNFDDPGETVLRGPLQIPIAEFDSDLCGLERFFCFAQPNTHVTLDPLREIVNWRVQYRNFGNYETLVGSFTTDVDGTDRGGVRWFELRKTLGTSWSLFQEGLVAGEDANRWVGSIAMDGEGNIALGYSITSSEISPSIRYTGRLATDPPGVMTVPEQSLIDGFGSQASFSRWGDYNSLNLDPVDDCTFWLTGEYWASNDTIVWTTRIGSFAFKVCGNEVPVAVARAATPAECSSPAGAQVVLDGSASTDFDDGIVGFHWRLDDDVGTPLGSSEVLTALLPLGRNAVSLVVVDAAGQTATDSLEIDVVDTTPPRLAARLAPSVLRPPNRRLVEVHAVVQTLDACGPAQFVLQSVASNQPGGLRPDIVGVETGTADTEFELRAKRRRGQERVYTARYAATDSSGNTAFATAEAVVPQRPVRPWQRFRLLLRLLGLLP